MTEREEIDALAEQVLRLRKEHNRLFTMTLELIEATLELSQAARMQNDEIMRSRGDEAFKAVGRALDRLRTDEDG
ncbi:hypothetical protein [Vreelandella boliviensis]|uniref:hypothetical protein n=1 Tax=Vreelandella boliviensis TaxID=223527 RepID=UPI001B8C3D0D|nr:hypothetical protein [Halomonas boliviensis]MBS3668057.1 hypothetical protein [Halomonas boliviensis]